jgi:flotillin
MPSLYTAVGLLVSALILVYIVMLVLRAFVRCPSNKILCVFGGMMGGGRAVNCYLGGFKFVVPIVQEARFLELTPMTINIPLRGALSQQNIRVNVPCTFTIAVSTDPDIMFNAATRLLDLTPQDIEAKAAEILFGQLRLTIASLTIEQINQDRERFLESIRNNVEAELKKIGLCLINVNVTDITDESGYIESIGKKAASTAINQAKVDVAIQEKAGDIGRAEADRERRVRVATLDADAVVGENEAKAKVAETNAMLSEKQAEAQRRSQVAGQNAEAEIQISRALAESKRLEAEIVVPQEIARKKIEIEAEATANKQRKEAAGEAEAIIALRSAEAQGIHKVLTAKAEGYRSLVQSCGEPREAATMLLVEKLEDLVRMQTEAISKLKIDKITVWDSGDASKGSSTANFVSSMVKSLPALHDIAGMAGIDLPNYLGHVRPGTGGVGTGAGQLRAPPASATGGSFAAHKPE